jgi:hypothetical protein
MGFEYIKSTTSSNLVTYVNTIIHSVSTQGRTDSVYFDLSNNCDIVPHSLLLRKLQLNFPLVMSIDITAT